MDLVSGSGVQPRQERAQRGKRLRVVIAEDTYLVREALERILDSSKRVEVVGSCGDFESLMVTIDQERPDVVLNDIRMPPTGTDEGIRVAQKLRTSNPVIGVVVLSQFADPGYALALLEDGSDRRGYLLKERVNDPGQLISAIETVADGGSVVDAKVIEVLVQAHLTDTKSPLSELTPREHEVLAQLAQGKSNGAIAESMVLTKRAVEKHINAIFMKLDLDSPDDVSRRVKAALIYLASEKTAPPS